MPPTEYWEAIGREVRRIKEGHICRNCRIRPCPNPKKYWCLECVQMKWQTQQAGRAAWRILTGRVSYANVADINPLDL